MYFDIHVYEELAKIAAGVFREDYSMDMLPRITTQFPGVMSWKKYVINDVGGFKNGKGISALDESALIDGEYKTFELGTTQTLVSIGADEKNLNADFIAQLNNERMREFGRQFALSIMKGFYSDGFDADGNGVGQLLINGILQGATTVQDLDGTDSALTAAGDVIKALNKMLQTLPAKYRTGDESNIILFMSNNFKDNARSSTFRASGTNQSELDTWMAEHPNIRVIANDQFVYSNGDDRSTTSRLLMIVSDPAILEVVISQGFTVLNEVNDPYGGIRQGWAARGGGCVYRSDGVLYSEPITWA